MTSHDHRQAHRAAAHNRALAAGIFVGVCYGAVLGSLLEQHKGVRDAERRRQLDRIRALERRAFLEDHPEYALPDEPLPRSVSGRFAPEGGLS